MPEKFSRLTDLTQSWSLHWRTSNLVWTVNEQYLGSKSITSLRGHLSSFATVAENYTLRIYYAKKCNFSTPQYLAHGRHAIQVIMLGWCSCHKVGGRSVLIDRSFAARGLRCCNRVGTLVCPWHDFGSSGECHDHVRWVTSTRNDSRTANMYCLSAGCVRFVYFSVSCWISRVIIEFFEIILTRAVDIPPRDYVPTSVENQNIQRHILQVLLQLSSVLCKRSSYLYAYMIFSDSIRLRYACVDRNHVNWITLVAHFEKMFCLISQVFSKWWTPR